jgi:hypothetical protein
MEASHYGDPDVLVDHGPPSTSGVSSVTYQFGVSAGVNDSLVTSKMSVTYDVQDTPIQDQSNSSTQLAKWWHNVPESGTNGMNAYTCEPGATIRVVPDTPTRIHNYYKVQYGQPDWWWWDFWSYDFSVDTTLNYPRSLNVFVIKPSDSSVSFVGAPSNVESGVLSAVNDANSRTQVKLDNEQINVYEVTSTSGLYGLAQNPPLGAVIVDTDGEVVPMPNQYLGPSVYIYSPTDGTTVYYSPTVYAYVYPPPPSSLQLSYNPSTGQTSYVWCSWYRPSTGVTSNWIPMNPQSASGGSYYGFPNLPAYDTYIIHVGAYANNLWTDAYITVYYAYGGGDGGGCPYVSTWNGTQYVIDNNMLPGSEFSNGTDATDYYKLQQPLVPNSDGTYSLKVSEFEKEDDFLDQVQLLAVDHPSNVSVGASPYGQILTYTNPYPPVSAITNDNRNVKQVLGAVDGNYYQGYNGSFIDLNFGDLDVSHGAKLVMRADMFAVKTSIHVQVQDSKGSRVDVAEVIPRKNWETEIIDMSNYLPDAKGNLKVRLYFTANHRVDFVGLDTSPQAAVTTQTGVLASAVHEANGIQPVGGSAIDGKATYQSLLSSDNSYAELTPGYEIKMNFKVPTKKDQKDVRDFMLVVNGWYKEAGDPARAVAADWQSWFNLLADRTRNYGWIWTNVAGYSCYYFGNTWYTSQFPSYNAGTDPQQPHANGLQAFLGTSITALPYDGHTATISYDFVATSDGGIGFSWTYINLTQHRTIYASRPLPSSAAVCLDALGYVDSSTGDSVTVAIAMNNTVLNKRSYTGAFIHNGVSPDVDMDGVANTASDDWYKGYIASAMAIEEARSLIMWPAVEAQVVDNTQAAAFTVSMRPGGWGEGRDPENNLHFRFVDLIVQIGAHYDTYVNTVGYVYESYLSQADFDLSGGGNNVYYNLDTSRCGLDTGGTSSKFMTDFLWWTAGTVAGAIPVVGAVIGPAIGLVPLIQEYFDTTVSWKGSGYNYIYVNGTNVDPNSDSRGTISFFVQVRFYGTEGQGLTPYTFTFNAASWVGFFDPKYGSNYPRYACLTYTRDTTFWVKW